MDIPRELSTLPHNAKDRGQRPRSPQRSEMTSSYLLMADGQGGKGDAILKSRQRMIITMESLKKMQQFAVK